MVPRSRPHHTSVDCTILVIHSMAHSLQNTVDLPSYARSSARILSPLIPITIFCSSRFQLIVGKSEAIQYEKASSYIAQYPILRTVQSALEFTSLTDLFTQTASRLLWEASSHMLQLMREGYAYTYPPLSIARYSCI